MNPLSLVVRNGCAAFSWFMVVFGVNIVVHGYMTPGGGFQGGAIIATCTALLLVAYGGRKLLSCVYEKVYDAFDEFGLLAFLLLAFLGFPNSFFYNFLVKPFTVAGESTASAIPEAGTIALMSIAVGFEVTGALSLIILTMFKGVRFFRAGSPEEELGHDR